MLTSLEHGWHVAAAASCSTFCHRYINGPLGVLLDWSGCNASELTGEQKEVMKCLSGPPGGQMLLLD